MSETGFDSACAPVAPALTLRSLLPGARSAIIVASGGRDLFQWFRRSQQAADGQPHPLDRFTRVAVEAPVAELLAGRGVAHRLLFPFVAVGNQPVLPFQRLGRAAGVGAPGPLGLQIHPEFGPWWAYRALLVVAADLGADDPVPAEPCVGCPAPCVPACPAGAVRALGFSIIDCHARRRTAPACRLSCDARIRCVLGPQHRYTDEQLAFHMAASLPR